MFARVAAASLTCVSSIAVAGPSGFSAFANVATLSGFNTLGNATLIDFTPVNLGGTTRISAFNPAFGADLDVSFIVETVGFERTVTIVYEGADGEPIVTPAAFDSLDQTGVTRFTIEFALGFEDDEWDGDTSTRFTTRRLSADGGVFSDFTSSSSSSSLSSGFVAFGDNSTPPSEVGFLGSTAIFDRLEWRVSYGIVPSPAGSASLLVAAAIGVRRRRS